MPRDRSASRDAPGVEVAHGPRAQLSLGAEPGLWGWGQAGRRWRVEAQALLAAENAATGAPLVASETGRVLLGLAIEKGWSGPAAPEGLGALALRAGFGVERAWRDVDASLEAPNPWDLPFGAGGVFTSFGASWSLRRGPLGLRGQIAERVYLPGWLLLFRARVAADLAGSAMATGIAHAPSSELTLTWHRAAGFEPTLALFAGHLAPLDSAARPAFFGRAMLGPAWDHLWTFVSLDVGNGKGHLTIRRETRLSVGARVALPAGLP